MPDFQNFEEDEETLFADENSATEFPTKAPVLVPFYLQNDFLAWLDMHHPEIQGVHHITLQIFFLLIKEFEQYIGRNSGYTLEQWWHSIHQP